MEAARRATCDDLAEIDRLADLARAQLAGQRGGPLLLRREARPEGPMRLPASDDPDTALIVGTIDGVVVGYGYARAETLRDGGRLAVVDELFVEPEARGVGVGEAIMDELVTFARDRGCAGIDAVALPGDRATKNFFERFGLTARAIIVHRDLEPRP